MLLALPPYAAYPRRVGGVGDLTGQRLETFPLASQWLLPVAN
jgi:hypothetical protein